MFRNHWRNNSAGHFHFVKFWLKVLSRKSHEKPEAGGSTDNLVRAQDANPEILRKALGLNDLPSLIAFRNFE